MRKKIGIVGKYPFQNFLLMFSLIAVSIFLLLISSIYYVEIKKFIEEKKEETTQLRMDQISNEVQIKFNNMYETMNNLKANEIVIRYIDELTSSELSPSEKYYQLKSLEEYLYSIRKSNELVDSILIITPESQFSSDSKYVDYKFNGMKFINEVESNYHFVSIGETDKMIVHPSSSDVNWKEGTYSNNLNNQMYFGSNIVSADGQHKGVILLFINMSSLDDHIFYADQIALFDRKGEMLFKGSQVDGNIPNEIDRLEHRKKGLSLKRDDVELHYSSIPFYKFQLIYAEQLGYYSKQIQTTLIVIALIFIFTVLIAFIFSRIVGRKVLQPLYQLLSSLKEYEESRNYRSLFQKHHNRRIKMSLRERFFFYFLMTILLPLVIFMVIFYWQTSKIVTEDLQESYHTVHEKMARIMSNEIKQRELIMARIALNNTLQYKIQNKKKDEIGQELLDKKKYSELMKQNIWIYNQNGEFLYTNNYSHPKRLNDEFYQTLLNSDRKISYTLERNHFNNVTIIIGMPIFSPDNYSKAIGYITADIDSNQLANFYSNWRKSGLELQLVDQNNKIISHQNPLKIGGGLKQKEDLSENDHIYSTRITEQGWKFISKYNYTDIQKQVNQLFISNLYLLFMIFLLLLVFSYWISKRILRPFSQLNKLFNTFDLKGSHHVIAEQFSGIDEVDTLTRNFNTMIQRMEELLHESLEANKERIQLKYEKREIQINALQSQINPHFLYNTLDNLIYLVEANETDKSVDMIISLSRLFRYITNKEQVMIAIRDELAYTKSYIKIMSYRFDNFECIWDIDEEILEYKTVKLIIQPVIENSIHHGARKTKNMVTIHISCKRIGDTVCIVVKDNALGIKEEELSIVKKQLISEVLNKSGIYNVNGRIKLHFGSTYGLDIESKFGEGTQVSIVIPIVK
ncbi:sensor histidine kinase [Peribacillus huizhouensis]|uniref:Sensor histidine kinase YesM n=1 Tax=Peribacillus huizhouensis TaxID=1501239 RepID=A0ABR6CNW2_9BACI|nr:sensor histidine kinase [Peribacillus huizhouensis]MBA9026660.1 sensor histidine kinase YesM [Peribacillus huizhouensis]